MVRTLLIVLGLFAVAAGFVWLKKTPGELALTVGDTVYAIGLAQAVFLLVVLAVVSVVLYIVIHLVWIAPGRMLFAWRDRRNTAGREALSRGLLAIAAGDVRQAERASKEAAKRLPDAPLTALLQAQAAQLKGDRESAGTAFTAMLDNPETRIAGLHGLFVEAERQGAAEAARHYAQTAYDARPDTAWAVRALLRCQAGAGDWDAALATLASAVDTRAIEKKLIRRFRAVLLTAKAMAGEDTDKVHARQAALEAHHLEPALAPAAIVAGRILAREGEIGRAAKVLEETWKASPHPEVADAYAHVRSGDSALDRMARMKKLMQMKPHDDVGRMAFASAAIEATEFEAARDTLKPIVATRPTRNALILMAELDEAEHGDRGRVREWLDRAVRAPRDPVWTADGIILDEWAPVAPVSGRIGAVEWKLPVDEGENRLSIDVDDEAFKPREFLPIAAAATADDVNEADDTPDGIEPEDGEFVDVTPVSVASGGAAETDAPDKTPADLEAADAAAEEGAEAAADDETSKPEPETAKAAAHPDDTSVPDDSGGTAGDGEAARSAAAAPADAPDSTSGLGTDSDGARSEDEDAEDGSGGEGDDTGGDEPKMPHFPPDDPGVDETEKEPEPRGFRLF